MEKTLYCGSLCVRDAMRPTLENDFELKNICSWWNMEKTLNYGSHRVRDAMRPTQTMIVDN